MRRHASAHTTQSQALSKFSNSDIIVYVGCGERGNGTSRTYVYERKLTSLVEMAEVLADVSRPKLKAFILLMPSSSPSSRSSEMDGKSQS